MCLAQACAHPDRVGLQRYELKKNKLENTRGGISPEKAVASSPARHSWLPLYLFYF